MKVRVRVSTHLCDATDRQPSTQLQCVPLLGLRPTPNTPPCRLSIAPDIVDAMTLLAALVIALLSRNIIVAFLSYGLQVAADWEPDPDWEESRQNRPCYWPDGTRSLTTFPCRYYPEDSICCSLGWACMVEGFCYLNATGIAERQARTARDWDGSNCPLICRKSKRFHIVWLNHCGQSNA